MKKIIILVLVIAAIGVGVIYFKNEKAGVTEQAPVALNATSLVSLIPGSSLIEKATPSTIATFYISGIDVQKAYENVNAYIAMLRATTVWKTLGLEAQISNFQQKVTSSNPELDAALITLGDAVRSGATALSGSVDLKDSVASISMRSEFSDISKKATATTALFKVLTLIDPKFQSSGNKGTLLLKPNPESPVVTIDAAPGDSITTVTSLSGVVLPTPNTSTLNVSTQENLLTQSSVSGASGYLIADNTLLMRLVPIVASRLAVTYPDVNDSLPAITTAANNAKDKWSSLASTLSIFPSLRAKSCGVALQAKPDVATGSSRRSAALGLIGPRTPFLFSASISAVLEYLQAAIDATQSGNDAARNQEAKADFDALKAGFTSLSLSEISIVTSLPANAMSPLYGFVFPTEKPVTITDFAAQLSKGLETLKKRYPGAQLPTLMQSTPTSVALDLSNGTTLEGRVIADHLVVFTSTPAFFDEVATTSKREKPYVTDERLERSKLSELANDSSMLVYISTSSLMPLAKQFAPFLSLLNPEARLTDKDYTELLSLLEFNAVYAESALPISNGVSCSIMGIGLLDSGS